MIVEQFENVMKSDAAIRQQGCDALVDSCVDTRSALLYTPHRDD